MPKFYCDYCDIYLAHSSIGGRRQHCIGRKHIQNKIDYYQRTIRETGVPFVGGPPPSFMPPGGPFPGIMTMPPPPPPGFFPPGTDPAKAFAMMQAMFQGKMPPPPPRPFP